MHFDVSRHLGAVSRALENIEHNGRPARKIIASRTYAADLAEVWDALTNPTRIPRWFLPVEGDLRLGGRYQLVGNASGEITTCDPPDHLAVTWEMHGDVSWVDVRLVASADGVHLELVHVAHVPDEFWSTYGPGAVGVGWELGLLGLDRFLTTGATADPAAAEAWTTSEEGRSFLRQSSSAWGRASIQAGTPEAEAMAAAERTTAFYSGG